MKMDWAWPNFVGNAVYGAPIDGKENVASFEFIPWILGQCTTVAEAREFLARINLAGDFFSADLSAAPLHWLLADKDESIPIE